MHMKLPAWTIMLLLAFLAATAAGCGTTSSSGEAGSLDRATYDRISNGMSADEVRATAGEPQKTEQTSMAGGHSMGGMEMSDDMLTESWYYQGEKGLIRINFTNSRVTGKSGY